MSKRLLAAVATLAVLGLAAGAVPAFTADSGMVTVSVTAQAPATPCLEFLDPPGTSVNFGTLPFSQGQESMGPGDVEPVFRNCGTANERITIAGNFIQQVGWSLTDQYRCLLPEHRNSYRLLASVDDRATRRALGLTAIELVASAEPGTQHTLALDIGMPCAGSNGAGQTISTSVTLTAVIP